MASAAQTPVSLSNPNRSAPYGEKPQAMTRKQPGRNWIWIAVVIAGAGGVFAIWNYGLKQHFIPTNFGIVEPGRIYRSGQISRYLMAKTLKKYQIGLIVDLSYENTPDAQTERETAAAMGIPRLNLRLGGNGTGNPDFYPQAIKAIVDANQRGVPVLVHCQSGRSGRAASSPRIGC